MISPLWFFFRFVGKKITSISSFADFGISIGYREAIPNPKSELKKFPFSSRRAKIQTKKVFSEAFPQGKKSFFRLKFSLRDKENSVKKKIDERFFNFSCYIYVINIHKYIFIFIYIFYFTFLLYILCKEYKVCQYMCWFFIQYVLLTNKKKREKMCLCIYSSLCNILHLYKSWWGM